MVFDWPSAYAQRKCHRPTHNLFDLIQAKKSSEEPAREFTDYTVTVNEAGIPAGVTLQRKVG